MNKIILALFYIACSTNLFATDFITRWDMSKPGSNPNSISFVVGTTGVVNYTWETVPVGTSGSGTFTGNTATITGLPAGAIIRLHIDTANFNRININIGTDNDRLVDVEQWGTVVWSSMNYAFEDASNLNITATDLPNLSNVTILNNMFSDCSNLNGPSNINNWDVSNVTSMQYVFLNASSFNQPLENWDVSNVTTMEGLFAGATVFNQPLNNWNTSNVINMKYMFLETSMFNQPLNNWSTINVDRMAEMFAITSAFNQPLDNWNTSKVINMNSMFSSAISFNQPIGNWDVSQVKYMRALFNNATSFNQPLANWNTSNVEDMSFMFRECSSFNQPINNWDVNKAYEMSRMFKNATSFNQPLGDLNLHPNVTLIDALNGCGMDCVNYATTLNGWSNNPSIPSGVYLDAQNVNYSSTAQVYKDYLVNTKNWTINDAGICFPAQLNEMNSNEISVEVYPNPTSNLLKIKMGLNVINFEKSLYNAFGQLLFTTKSNEIDVSSFSKGIYYLKYEHHVVKVVLE